MSRMDRYYKNTVSNKRTSRNQELYKTIYEDSQYSNIEGIMSMDSSNEIDIQKIKNMLKNHDENSSHELKKIIPKEFPKYETFENDDDRVYDIRDILSRAKSNKEEEKYHNLKQSDLDMLNELRNKPKVIKPTNLEDMVDTITNTSKLNKMSDNELGLGLLSDLKSNENTIIENKDSIRSILEEAKKKEAEEKIEKTDNNIDRSFFTSSLSFKDEDFQQIEEIKKNVKKNNNLLKILIIIVMFCITVGILVIMFNLLK